MIKSPDVQSSLILLQIRMLRAFTTLSRMHNIDPDHSGLHPENKKTNRCFTHSAGSLAAQRPIISTTSPLDPQ